MKSRGGVSYRVTSPPLTKDRKIKPNNNGIAYAIHDDLSTTDDNNNYNPGPAIAPIPDNNFRHDPNDHTVDNNISYDIANGDIDSLQKLRGNRDSDTRDDCLDDFITYHVAPELKIRPSYEDCLNDNEAEIEILQINAMMI